MIRTRSRCSLGAWAGRRDGVAALEFALVAPVMGIFLLGMVDVADAIITLHRLNSAVQQVGLMATEMSVQPNQQTALTATQLDQASSVIYAVMPSLASDPVYNPDDPGTKTPPPYAVVVSDIVFTPTPDCTPNAGGSNPSNCMTASVAWSVPLKYGQQLNRACGTVQQTAASTAPQISSMTNLPTNIPTAAVTQGLSSVLVVDVLYQFTPIFGKFIGQINMRQTAYFNQRSYVATYITYTPGNTTGGVVCSPYT